MTAWQMLLAMMLLFAGVVAVGAVTGLGVGVTDFINIIYIYIYFWRMS